MSSYLKFQVQFHTHINQTVRIIGNVKELGEWDPAKGLMLQTNAQIYPDWTHDTFLEIPRGIVLEFKCVKFEGDRLIKWESFSIDMNRKYKTQYFKALLIMKEDNIQVIERPFQKYTGNHDCDIIDTTDARKIQDKFIKFDPLRKADGLSSSSDNSSLDFFRRQSKVSEDFNVIENQIEQHNRNDGIIQNPQRKLRIKKVFSDDDFSNDYNSQDMTKKHADEWPQTNNNQQTEGQQGMNGQMVFTNDHQQITKKGKGGIGIKFNQSSLNQISSNIPSTLENVFLLFNRVKKESNLSKERFAAIKKIVDLKDINLYDMSFQQNILNDSDESSSQIVKNIRNVKSMPYINTQSQEKGEKTFILVSYRLPYFVKTKKKNSARISAEFQVNQMYDFIENFDPLIDSIYQSLINVKLNLIWVGICNIYIENESDQNELRQYMIDKYRCYPLFYNDETTQLFARRFCSKFLYPQYDNIGFYEEERSWKVYKEINQDVANVLKQLTSPDPASIFAIAIYDLHFFLVPSYFLVPSHTQHKHSQHPTYSPHFQKYDFNDKITIAFFINRKFPQLQIFEALPQAETLMHSLFFSDIMSFSTYESCEPFLTLSQKMGCAVLHKAGGKIMLQCNGREILIRIEHPGININKLQTTKDIIHEECERRSLMLSEQNKHQIIGIDSISKNSGLEYKFRAFEKFLKKEKSLKSIQEYKLKQIVFFSTDSEFHTYADQLEYLNEIKSLARSINQSQSFYDSAIEIIEGDSLSFEEYFQYLSLSECFLSTALQETKHFHYMEYMFLKKDGQLILSNCIASISHFNTVNIVNPQDQYRIVNTLSKLFQIISKTQKDIKDQLNAEKISLQQQMSYNNTIAKESQSPSINIGNQTLIKMSDSQRLNSDDKKRINFDFNSGNESQFTKSDFQLSQPDKSRINITEKNSTSDQAQREFDYNYLIKFCSSQNWINHFISDIVKRQSLQKNTCIFFSTEKKSVVLDKSMNTVHTENISKIYERNSKQFIEINLQNLIYKCKNSKNAVFVFGFSSVFFDDPSNLLQEPKPNALLFKQIEELSKQPNVQIYIISGKSPELLSKYFGHIKNIILIANNGLKIQQTGCDLDFFQLTSKYEHTLWKMQVQTKMENFVQKTAGSYIIESEVQTSWHFENVQKEFAEAQKNELIKQLVQIVESMPGNEIFEGYDFVQVRPQCLNKGVMTKITLQNSCLLKQTKIDFLVVVGGRKTTDEEMLKSAREIIHDENISYIENNAPLILGSISSQLGALYCNHQFENNQELAVLLEMMNGNKQLLKTDQFANIKPHSTTNNTSNTSHNNIQQNIPMLTRNNTVWAGSNDRSNTNNSNSNTNNNDENSNSDLDLSIHINQNNKHFKVQDMKIPFLSLTANSLTNFGKNMI